MDGLTQLTEIKSKRAEEGETGKGVKQGAYGGRERQRKGGERRKRWNVTDIRAGQVIRTRT